MFRLISPIGIQRDTLDGQAKACWGVIPGLHPHHAPQEITITIPENVGCVDNRSQFIGQLN